MTERSEREVTEVAGSVDWFIERFGLMNEEDGMPRTAGRMFALMLIESGPISFSDLATRLEVSRGGVSTNTRLLEEFGMIERVSRRGERQDYFQVVENPWERIIERRVALQQRASDYVQTLVAAQPELPDHVKKRMSDMTSLIDAGVKSMTEMRTRLADERKARSVS